MSYKLSKVANLELSSFQVASNFVVLDLHVLERVHSRREDEEDRRRRPRLLERLGELDGLVVDVLVAELLLDEGEDGVGHPVGPEAAHHAEPL